MSKPKINSIVYYSTNYDDPIAFLRVIGFARQKGIHVIHGIINGRIDIQKVSEGDLVVLERDYCRSSLIHQKTINQARQLNKPVVFDLDDLLFELSENHPDRISSYYSDALLPMALAVMDADLVTVSTKPLADYLFNLNTNIKVVPNSLDDAIWQLHKPLLADNRDGSVTIGYMGGQSHIPDLEMVVPVLKIIRERYGELVRFHFWGVAPPKDLLPFSVVDYPSYKYEEFAKYFQEQRADLMIAPLVDNQFNSCKSGVKFLEYGALGVAGVYSKVGAYTEMISNGVDGFLAGTTEEWLEYLSFLIENPKTRVEIARAAQEKIKRDWLLSKTAGQLTRLFEQLLDSESKSVQSKPIFYDLFNSIAVQTDELFWKKDKQLKSLEEEKSELALRNAKQLKALEAEKNELLQTISILNEEVSAYSGSNSWKITKPLRQISSLIKKRDKN